MNLSSKIATIVTKLNHYATAAFSPRYLLLTNVTISANLSGLGDVLEQHYEILTGDITQYEPKRTVNMSASGATVGVLCHFWYQFLDSRLPGKSLGIVVKKIIVDQFIGSPLCIATFFCTLAVIEKSTFEELKNEVKQKALRLYIAEWVIWPPAQFINFYYLPNKFRVLYDNTISLMYDTYTSHVKHSPEL